MPELDKDQTQMDQPELPLDPAAERVRRKLVRFMVINFAILLVALMAVIGALVYKSSNRDRSATRQASSTSQAIQSGQIAIPAGFELVGQSLSGDRLSLHLRNDNGDQRIVIQDLSTGKPVATYALVPSPAQ